MRTTGLEKVRTRSASSSAAGGAAGCSADAARGAGSGRPAGGNDRGTVEFEFAPGVTCIVGPNGCGKSNVVDAIRWAMGEQSPRRLRGKGMEDVIFAGSDARSPVGLGEVVLTFDNGDGSGPPQLAAFGEETGLRVYLQVVENRWEDGRSRQRVVATLGRLDQLQAEHKQFDADDHCHAAADEKHQQ